MNKKIITLSKKIARKIICKMCKYLDKVEPNFNHNIAYTSKSEMPQEEKTGRLRISDGFNWIDKAVWVGIKNEFYDDVMQIIGR